ncbi:putative hydrolase of the HAD superfamily [Agromyces sp. CF514]|uniref:HAD family hydrolase n=1 Tax=Agromyces sp. CF514 TaxID=1881031 RepID=UPI0008F3401E|nr:HAD family hydrolase [Agromyces sp. CF514]SFR85990.1 putative hydrolase of the HAD superfamily [Agromyces sp. CF514]
MTSLQHGTVVLFDLDDTLMAHREAVAGGIVQHMRERAYLADAAAAQRLWHELEERHYHAYLAGDLTFEGQRRARARDFALAHGEELDDPAAGVWFDRYFERYRDEWRLHDDALPALDELESRFPGVRLGIITNGEPDFQRAKLDRLGVSARFEHVVASGALGVTKPDRRIFAAAIELFSESAPVERAAYVGDRLRTDALGAADAGLVGVWLDRHDTQLDEDDATAVREAQVIVIPSLADLTSRLGKRWGAPAGDV